MATSAGSLIVSLGLNAAEFTSGLTKSEYEAKKFQQRLEKDIAAAGRAAAVGIGLIATAAVAAAVAVDQLVKQAGRFQDLAEKTGASAESLASFGVAAGVVGADMGEIAAASVKLTKNLLGVDDESKAAGAALTALGIPIKDFQALDPATQMEEVAKALAGFADGADKTAVAVALFGKSGADLLPFLKELAGDTGRQNILTKEQIRLADDYSDRQARSRAQLQLYAQALATEALPAINAVTEAVKEFIKKIVEAGTEGKNLGGSNAIQDWAEAVARKLAFVVDAADGVARSFELAGKAQAAQFATVIHPLSALDIWGTYAKDAQEILMRPLFGTILDEKIAKQKADAVKRAVEDRGFDPRKTLDFAGAIKPPAGGAKDKTTDAERYLESLEKQFEATLELNAAEKAEVEIYKLQQDSLSGLTEQRKAAIRDYAAQIDAATAAKKAEQERTKAEEEAMRIRERNSQAVTRAIEQEQKQTDRVREDNQQIEDQIAKLRGGEEAVRKLTAARLDALIVKEQERRDAMLTAGDDQRYIDAVTATIEALKKKKELAGDLTLAEQFAAEKKAAEDLANFLTDSFSNAFEGFIEGTKSAKDAFRDFAKDIESYLVKLALHKLGDAIFGSTTAGGPDFFTMLAKLIGGAITSAGGGGGVPGVGFSGGGFGEHFAIGGISSGGMATVGEIGPERVFLPRGAQVIPLNRRRGEGSSVQNIFNVNVMPGATTASAKQSAKVLAGAVMTSIRNP